MYDRAGARYLDAYNNVAHVGHCHPHVVSELARQASTLNTNTRYLDETILEYAERLSATLPEGLSRCMFVCTGTEANDLAWRLAKAYTGADGAIATSFAYHGNSTIIAAFDGAIKSNHTRDWLARFSVEIPKDKPWQDHASIYAHRVDEAIDALQARGRKPAACFFDSIFATDGLLIPQFGALSDALARVRAVGGICIADEVQSGYGRIGSHMWGFEALGITPDIVTMGKPAGNGHPIGVVVTRPENSR